MKSIIKVFAMFAIVSMGAWITPHKASAQQVSVSFQLFYDQLSPYGQWVNYPNYGYAWMPNAGAGFTPYSTGGHWVLTQYGWTWVSDYAWGWAPFHYGRWNYEPAYGWFWIPDNVWGPAWVSWRHSPGYYGWVPMGSGKDYDKDDQRWIFVKDKDIDKPDINHYYVNRTNNVTIIKNSTIIKESGPDKDEFQKIKGKPVQAVAVKESDQPGQHMTNGELHIYRPEVRKSDDNGQKAAPSKVTDIKDVKPESEKNAEHQPSSHPDKKNNQKEKPKQEEKPKQ